MKKKNRKSPGIYNISTELLKESVAPTAPKLTVLFSRIIEEHTVKLV